MKTIVNKLLIFVLITSFMVSCNKDDEGTHGTVKTAITDDPFPFDFVAEANVSIAKIELKNENGEYVTVFEGNAGYNMVGLTNGATANVNTTSIENGTYNEARITLSGASVQLTNNQNFDLNTQASGTSTITIDPALVVDSSQDSELLLDLDINDSFNFEGMSGVQLPDWITSIDSILGCSFDADFTAVDLNQTGTITGTVQDASGAIQANALVTVEVNGNTMSTQTDANGNFTFIGVANGSYTVDAEASNDNDGNTSVSVSGNATASCSITIN